jgi:hypothetical protein
MIVDPANIDGLNAINRSRGSGPCMGFKYDLNRFRAARGNSVPLHNVAGILRSNRFHPNNQAASIPPRRVLRTVPKRQPAKPMPLTAKRSARQLLRRWIG